MHHPPGKFQFTLATTFFTLSDVYTNGEWMTNPMTKLARCLPSDLPLDLPSAVRLVSSPSDWSTCLKKVAKSKKIARMTKGHT